MKTLIESFESNGYAVLENTLSDADILDIARNLDTLEIANAGTRNLLAHQWCVSLAQKIKLSSGISSLLPADAVTVQCTGFIKSENKNWLVSLHRDTTIPVKNRLAAQGWSAWSEKEGVQYARPPIEVLNQLVAVRLHLEDNNHLNGPLSVVPGSHLNDDALGDRVDCIVPKGGALIMRPRLLHASSKVERGTRRVLHFLFGSENLPNGAEWEQAV